MTKTCRNKTLAFFAVVPSLLIGTACDTSKDSKRPILSSPSGEVRGGVDVTQTVALTAAADSRFKQNFIYQADRKPVRVVIDHTLLVNVTKTECDAGVCTIEYKQKEKAVATPGMILYHLEDEQGSIWSQGRLDLKGQQPKVPQNFTFNPRFKEVVRITVPITDQNGAEMEQAPELTALYGEGGEIVKASCTTKACDLDYLYKQNSYNPAISFQFSTPEMVGPSFRLTAVPEVITYLPSRKSTFDGQTSITLLHGVDYSSSWNRPTTYVRVESASGLNQPTFSCSDTGCMASHVKFNLTQSMTMTYRVGTSPDIGRVDWDVITPEITPAAKEAVISNDRYTDILFVAGKDYTSTGDIPATAIEVDRTTYVQGLSFGSTSCDAAGTCRLSLYYSGPQPFVLLNYNLRTGSYQSPKQTLKLVPQIANTDKALEVWDDRKGPFTLELKPGRDYVTADASLATSIIIVDNSYALKFPAAPVLDDSNRSQVFACDADGVCRATVAKTSESISESSLRLKVVTPTSKGAVLEKKVVFKRDAIKFNDANEYMSVFGEEVNATVDSFSLRLVRGQHYNSEFPAQILGVSATGSGLSLANGNTIACDAEGSCLLEGRFTSDTGYMDLGLVLKNAYGASSRKTLRVIREKFTPFRPNLVRYVLEETGSSQFELVIARGDARGYNADENASKMRVTAAEGFLVDAPKATDLTVDCVEGSCRLKIKALSRRDQFTYRLLDDNGKESVPFTIALEYPQLLAIDTRVQVPADLLDIKFHLPAEENQKFSFELPEGVKLETTEYEWVYDRMNVKLRLEKALIAGQELTIGYQMHAANKISNKGLVTLQAIPSLSLKPDLTIRANPVADAPETFTLVLKYSEHFNQLPAGTNVRNYWYHARDGLDIKLDTTNVLQTRPVQCDQIAFQCTYTFARSSTGALPPVKAHLKGGQSNPVTSSVLPGTFTIQFD